MGTILRKYNVLQSKQFVVVIDVSVHERNVGTSRVSLVLVRYVQL